MPGQEGNICVFNLV